MSIFYSVIIWKSFSMKLIEHNEIAVAAESPSLHRLTLVAIPDENVETHCIRLVL